MENFPELVNWLTIGGSVSLVSWFVSWLLEDFDWWNAMKSQYRRLIILGAALAIGAGAKALQLNEELLNALLPYLDTGVLVITAWVATQVAHKADI